MEDNNNNNQKNSIRVLENGEQIRVKSDPVPIPTKRKTTTTTTATSGDDDAKIIAVPSSPIRTSTPKEVSSRPRNIFSKFGAIKSRLQVQRQKSRERSRWQAKNVNFITDSIAFLNLDAVTANAKAKKFENAEAFANNARSETREACRSVIDVYGYNVRIFDVGDNISTDEDFSDRVIRIPYEISLDDILMFCEETLRWIEFRPSSSSIHAEVQNESDRRAVFLVSSSHCRLAILLSCLLVVSRFYSKLNPQMSKTGILTATTATTTTTTTTTGTVLSSEAISGGGATTKNLSTHEELGDEDYDDGASEEDEGGAVGRVDHHHHQEQENQVKIKLLENDDTERKENDEPSVSRSSSFSHDEIEYVSRAVLEKEISQLAKFGLDELYRYHIYLESAHLPYILGQQFTSPPPPHEVSSLMLFVRNWRLWTLYRSYQRLAGRTEFEYRRVCIRSIMLSHSPRVNSKGNGCRPYVIVSNLDNSQIFFSSLMNGAKEQIFSPGKPVYFDANRIVQGDLWFKFYHCRQGKPGKKMFDFKIHSRELEPNVFRGMASTQFGEHLVYRRVPRIYIESIGPIDSRYDEDFDVHILASLSPTEWSQRDLQLSISGNAIPLKRKKISTITSTTLPPLSNLDYRKCWVRSLDPAAEFGFPDSEISDEVKQSNLAPLQMYCTRITCGALFWVHENTEENRSSSFSFKMDSALDSMFGASSATKMNLANQIKRKNPLKRPSFDPNIICPRCGLSQIPALSKIMVGTSRDSKSLQTNSPPPPPPPPSSSTFSLTTMMTTRSTTTTTTTTTIDTPTSVDQLTTMDSLENLGDENAPRIPPPSVSSPSLPAVTKSTSLLITQANMDSYLRLVESMTDRAREVFPHIPDSYLRLIARDAFTDVVSDSDRDDRLLVFLDGMLKITEDSSELQKIILKHVNRGDFVNTPFGYGLVSSVRQDEYQSREDNEEGRQYSSSEIEEEKNVENDNFRDNNVPISVIIMEVVFPFGKGFLNSNQVSYPSKNNETYRILQASLEQSQNNSSVSNSSTAGAMASTSNEEIGSFNLLSSPTPVLRPQIPTVVMDGFSLDDGNESPLPILAPLPPSSSSSIVQPLTTTATAAVSSNNVVSSISSPIPANVSISSIAATSTSQPRSFTSLIRSFVSPSLRNTQREQEEAEARVRLNAQRQMEREMRRRLAEAMDPQGGRNDKYKSGASQEQIDLLPLKIVEKDIPHDKCLICQNCYLAKESIRTLTCFHSFHAECIDEWLKRKALCPVCNRQQF